MTDTRKDKRAPVALKVRFKSATVDEFIEQYSKDISRGGMFIKSRSPMSVGTLLKFELLLKDETRIIHGVGRVVWKREASESTGEDQPPGMGIKFIKMDPASRALVDQIVAQRQESPGEFESGSDADSAGPQPTTQPASFFPTTSAPQDLPPPEDRTQLRHVNEFIASALAGADDAAAEEAARRAEESRRRAEQAERDRLAAERAAAERAEQERLAAERAAAERAEQERLAAERAAATRAVAERAVGPRTTDAEASAATTGSRPSARPAPVSPPLLSTSQHPPPPEPSSSRALPVALGVAALLVVGWLVYSKLSTPAPVASDAPTAAPPTSSGSETPSPASEPAGGTQSDSPGTGESPAGPTAETPQPPSAAGTGTNEAAANTEAVAPSGPRLVTLRVESTPPGASVVVGGVERARTPGSLELAEGTAVELTFRLEGHAPVSRTVTPGRDSGPVRVRLESLPYVLSVSTTPPGARVVVGGRSAVAPADITLGGRPSGDVSVVASLRGHEDAQERVPLASFVERDGAFRATLSLVLPERTRSPRGAAATRMTERPTGETESTGSGASEPETPRVPEPEPPPPSMDTPPSMSEPIPDNPFGK
ncbi:MAG: TIGR02266 family protein [Myxococcales bacterium]|nr:TIGR02266 family protein [Myxococcales bacterium]